MLKPHRVIALSAIGLLAAIVAWRTWSWLRGARREITPTADRRLDGARLVDANRRFYNALWNHASLIVAPRFNTWPLVDRLLPRSPSRIEVGAGLRPRLPIPGTDFVDLSAAAVEKLRMAGGRAIVGSVSALPFPDDAFDLVCALDIIEHAEDDDAAIAELARIACPGAWLLISVPLHPARWTVFDDFVGHRKRYEPLELAAKVGAHRLKIESSAAYGMQPRFPGLIDFAMRCLLHRRERALWYYTHLFMPIGLLCQPRLRFSPGMIPSANVDEILLVCRKNEAAPIA
ncbi:MAG: class I SAM-dependent methyltransferase [Terrimicrobiaceae bacterium]|nr:class I SAM-dependent methyltransferase [Terrimicrobiaceae bacterium]